MSQLGAKHDLAITIRKRTTIRLTGASPVELATDALKSCYFEAKAMQSGHHTHQSIQNWFWFETFAPPIKKDQPFQWLVLCGFGGGVEPCAKPM